MAGESEAKPHKTLIAIVNARHRAAWRSLIRNSWLSQVPKDKADVFFFCGNLCCLGKLEDLDSVIQLPCPDGYEQLPRKIQAILRWAIEKGYEHILKIDDDVVLRPTDFLSSGYDAFDFTGQVNRPGPPEVSFGFCYTLNRQCMKLMTGALLPNNCDDELWVAHTLAKNQILLTDMKQYALCQTPPKLTRKASDLVVEWWDLN